MFWLSMQTLLDRDHVTDPKHQPDDKESEDWQHYYDVCTAIF